MAPPYMDMAINKTGKQVRAGCIYRFGACRSRFALVN